jgi:uncharacterized protein YndB with AHSA1/START domain
MTDAKAQRVIGSPVPEFSQPSEFENAVTRLFRASPERLFSVFMDPNLAPALWAADPSDVKIEEMDPRPGGRFSIRVRSKDGSSVRFFGEYREVDPPRRVVNTFEVSSLPGVTAIETDEFERVGEFTRLSVRWKFTSRENRDKMWGPEAEAAITAIWESVDRILERGA